MFDGDLTSLSTADLLESAAEHRAEANRADARLLVHAQVYADRFHPDVCPTRPGRRSCDGRERAVVLGGEGCPEIAEFAVAEFGVMLGLSPKVAADYLGTALALRHRFPFTWARVLAGEATPWKACRLVAECSKLSEDAARYVDKRVAGLIDSITPYRLEKIIKAAKFHADPESARAEADEKRRERGVFVGQSDEHGTKTTFIKAASGAVTRHDATIAGIADALKTFGDTRSVQARRAEAVGIIADPRFTQELLHQAREHHLHRTAPDTARTGTNTSPTTDHPTDRAAGHGTDHPTGHPTDRANGHGTDHPTGHPTDRATGHGTAHPTDRPTDHATGHAADHVTGQGTGHGAGRGVDRRPLADDRAGPAHHTRRASWREEDLLADSASHRGEPVPDDETDRDTPDPSTGDNTRPAGGCRSEEDLLADCVGDRAEPGPDDEADRDAPHPSDSDLPDPLDAPFTEPVESFDPGLRIEPDDGEPLDAAARRALDARLAQIRRDAHTNPRTGRPSRPGQTEIYVHLTDHTLATGTGVLRAEGIGPLLADQLTELVGHGPYTVKPVIDLNDAVSVDAYEIPDRIRERIKLTHPVEIFPYGTRETHPTMDLDHIQPYDPLGPPGQTNTTNLAPLGRFTHRVKTHARGWNVQRLNNRTLEWTTPHGFTFHVTPTGTHRVQPPWRPPDSR